MTRDEFYAKAMIAAMHGMIHSKTLEGFKHRTGDVVESSVLWAEALTAEWEKTAPKELPQPKAEGKTVTREQLAEWWNREFPCDSDAEDSSWFWSLCVFLGLEDA